MITIEVNGNEYDGFISGRVKRDLDNFAGSFSLNLAADDAVNFPIPRQSKIKIFADEVQILDGFVEDIIVNEAAEDHSIQISGRDKTADVIDTTTDGAFEFQPPAGLISITQQLLTQYGIENIQVIDQTGGAINDFGDGDAISGEFGDSILDVLETYARQRQVFIVTNYDGNIEYIRTGEEDSNAAIFNRTDDRTQNNVLSGQVKYNDTQRFNTYRVHSQGNNSQLNAFGKQSAAGVTQRIGEATDNFIRSGRTLNIMAERASNLEDLQQRAIWEANIRRARSFSYEVTVQGHSRNAQGQVWTPNQLVRVLDEFADIDAILLIKGVEFETALNGGNTTKLCMVVKDAYSLQAEQDAREARANRKGEKFTEGGSGELNFNPDLVQ